MTNFNIVLFYQHALFHKLKKERSVFNFFSELKKLVKKEKFIDRYNIVNMSGRILYVEGHTGLCQLSQTLITFKFKGGMIIVEGSDMILGELSETTIKIVGNIKRVEAM